MPEGIPMLTNGRSLGAAVLVFRAMRQRALRLGDVATAASLAGLMLKLLTMSSRRTDSITDPDRT